MRAEYEESERRARAKSRNNAIGWRDQPSGSNDRVQNTVGSREKERKYNKSRARDSLFMRQIYLSPNKSPQIFGDFYLGTK